MYVGNQKNDTTCNCCIEIHLITITLYRLIGSKKCFVYVDNQKSQMENDRIEGFEYEEQWILQNEKSGLGRTRLDDIKEAKKAIG